MALMKLVRGAKSLAFRLQPIQRVRELYSFLGHYVRCILCAKKMWGLKNSVQSTIFCVGSGSSLKRQDLSLLRGQHAILLNHAYNLADKIVFGKAFIMVADTRRFNELSTVLMRRSEIKLIAIPQFGAEQAPRPLRPDYIYFEPRMDWIRSIENIRPLVSKDPRFSTNPLFGFYFGHSVVFSAIQLAYFMGARRIVLLGIDMERPTGRVEGDYAFESVQWHPEFLDYKSHARSHFIVLRDELSQRGVELLNATEGGRVDVLHRVTLSKAIE